MKIYPGTVFVVDDPNIYFQVHYASTELDFALTINRHKPVSQMRNFDPSMHALFAIKFPSYIINF